MKHKDRSSNAAPQVRELGFKAVFAPSDFAACVASGYSNEKLEVIAQEVEQSGDDGSLTYKNNIAEIAKFRESLNDSCNNAR
ncbi:hypothetical protein BM525_21090 (plasmid) [Alteromonas mediterranea]|uniref:Uncharacterized protein n=1 Tax=Alteromonas mediterranea TaxID=314275 RepID=A0AAC9NU12_9ALTE|nr:hypothetical protein [Alteromonas mediterranea]APD92356.1 hypothetical protein BM524_20865 [Alteromonas mediterranea]APE00217.1 hypothetical protein BM525_21090 [Alteromonas mediterranea]